jgi:hypothetical protein
MFTVAGPSAPLNFAGATAQFSATLTLPDGVMQDQTNAAEWSTSNSEVVTISATGLATAKGEGSAVIRAAFQGSRGEKSLSLVFPWRVSFAADPQTKSRNSFGMRNVSAETTGLAADEVALAITANDVKRLRNFRAELIWDRNVLSLSRSIEGDFMKQGGALAQFSVLPLGSSVKGRER